MKTIKRNVRAYLYRHYKKDIWDGDIEQGKTDVLDLWPNLKLCVGFYYKNCPEMIQYRNIAEKPIAFDCTKKFMRSLDKYCTTKTMRLRLIDELTRKVYRIPSAGLRDVPIKERSDLWHFYVTDSWRVFYRKKGNRILLEDFCPHKKPAHSRHY